NEMKTTLRMLMLLTDGFGGVGGIAKFNRDFLQALDSCGFVERVLALPRLIVEPIKGAIVPEAVVYDRNAAGGKIAFLRRLMAQLFRANHTNLVICSHLNLLPAAWLVARLRAARLILIIFGIEAWKPPRSPLARHLVSRADGFISISQFSARR